MKIFQQISSKILLAGESNSSYQFHKEIIILIFETLVQVKNQVFFKILSKLEAFWKLKLLKLKHYLSLKAQYK
mgnify:CR=1 FL=1